MARVYLSVSLVLSISIRDSYCIAVHFCFREMEEEIVVVLGIFVLRRRQGHFVYLVAFTRQ